MSVHSLAGGTTGFTGADLANLVNEAALLAGRRSKHEVRGAAACARLLLMLVPAQSLVLCGLVALSAVAQWLFTA